MKISKHTKSPILSNPLLLTLSDTSSDHNQNSPTLFTIAQENSASSDPHTTTNESITTFDENALDLSEKLMQGADFAYSSKNNTLNVNEQIKNPLVFDQITKNFQEDTQIQQKSKNSARLTKRFKKQICVKYKEKTSTPNGTQKSLSEELQKLALNASQKIDNIDRKSLTYHNPIAIIQNLDMEEQANFSMTIPLSRTGDKQLEDLKFENLELKQQLKQQQILFESKKYTLKCQKQALVQEIAKNNTKIQLLEQENSQLSKNQSIPTKNAETCTNDEDFISHSCLEKSIQCTINPSSMKSMKNSNCQTEDDYIKNTEKLKQDLKSQLVIIEKYEKERAGHRAIIEKQQKLLTQCEQEKSETEKKRQGAIQDMQMMKFEHEKLKKNANSAIADYKTKITNLETENKVLSEENSRLKEEIAIIDEQPEALKEMTEKLSHFEQLYTKYEQEAKEQKKISDELTRKLDEALKREENYKSDTKKQYEKIRELKKERDQLKIDNLKQKQLFTEKCESYREIRAALRKKLKQKDDILTRLQREVDQMQQPNMKKDFSQLDISNIENQQDENERNYQRPRSLENTGKHALKDLTTTFHLEELSDELKKKLEGVLEANTKISKIPSERTPEGSRKTPAAKVARNKIAVPEKAVVMTEKSKSFYSDDTGTGIDGKPAVFFYFQKPQIGWKCYNQYL